MMSQALFSDLGGLDLAQDVSSFCPMLTNVSACAATEASDAFVVAVYNPLPRSAIVNVRLPTISDNLVEVRHLYNRQSLIWERLI